MATYLFLYTEASETMPSDENQQADSIQAWTTWFEQIGDSLVDRGNPFTSTRKTISSDKSVSDSPYAIPLTGYSIIKAYSYAVAVEIAKDCPVLKTGGQVLINEIFPTM